MRLPPPVPLPDPPGDPSVLADVVQGLGSAAFGAGVLVPRLAGARAAAPTWQGSDAAAAGVQVAATCAVADRVHGVLSTAFDRLGAHRDLLADVRARLAVLREQQVEDHLAGTRRLQELTGAVSGLVPGQAEPAAQAVVEEFRAAEAARQAEHDRLLDDVTADAAAVSGALAAATATVGATGTPGDADRVTLHLALAMPGWGEAELVELGRDLAAELLLAGPEEAESLLAGHADLLAVPAAAAAVLQAMRGWGVLHLLEGAAEAEGVRPSPMTRFAQLVTTALASGLPGVTDVLTDALGPADDGPLSASAALGWGALARSATLPAPFLAGLAQRLVTDERSAERVRWDQRSAAPDRDPLAEVLAALVDAGGPVAAATLLQEPATWDGLLRRHWSPDAGAFERLVDAASLAPEGLSSAVTWQALAGVGRTAHVHLASLPEVSPEVLALGAVADTLARLVAGHLGALDRLVAGHGTPSTEVTLSADQVDAVRGLGLLALHPGARSTVFRAGTDALRAAPLVPGGPGPELPARTVGVLFAALDVGQWVGRTGEVLARARRTSALAVVADVLLLPVGAVRRVGDGLSAAAGHAVAGDEPADVARSLALGGETGPDDVRAAVTAVLLDRLVADGALPGSAAVTGHGPAGPEVGTGPAALTAAQSDLLHTVQSASDAATASYALIGDQAGGWPEAPGE